MAKFVNPAMVKDTCDKSGLTSAVAKKALEYLSFYYVDPNAISAQDAPSVESLVKKFQKQFGIKANGELNEQTIRAMEWPRCGCPDYKMMKAASGPMAAKWGPLKLTYYVEKYVSGLSKSDQDDLLELAYQQWEDHCGLEITRVNKANEANMIISTGSGRRDNFDGPNGTLAWAYLPPGNSYNGQLLMRFDLAETWIKDSRDRGILFLNVACHEFGHFLGLDHSSKKQALMAPYYSPGITKPQANDDIPRIQRLYGVNNKPAPQPPTTPTNPPSPGKNTVVIENVQLSQIKINGKSPDDFMLI
ncbi:MAG: matrixin family metalloprotease [Candidatus Kariarchaeaceae archaeon]|jgi:hypothetical protein